MICPICDTWTHVLETRATKTKGKKRRYECANKHRFSTLENYADTETKVRKKQKSTKKGGKS
jgi:transcriptional regulator NrdR family protein